MLSYFASTAAAGCCRRRRPSIVVPCQRRRSSRGILSCATLCSSGCVEYDDGSSSSTFGRMQRRIVTTTTATTNTPLFVSSSSFSLLRNRGRREMHMMVASSMMNHNHHNKHKPSLAEEPNNSLDIARGRCWYSSSSSSFSSSSLDGPSRQVVAATEDPPYKHHPLERSQFLNKMKTPYYHNNDNDDVDHERNNNQASFFKHYSNASKTTTTTTTAATFAEERRLRRHLQRVTQRILNQSQQHQNNEIVEQEDEDEDDEEHGSLDIPLAIRMWLAIYDETAMEQAWLLLEHYRNMFVTSTNDHDDTNTAIVISHNKIDHDNNIIISHHEELFNLVMYNWKARWISQQAYWQTPAQLFDKLQDMVVQQSSTTTTTSNTITLAVPLTAFHTLLQAMARGMIVDQAQHKVQGISVTSHAPPPTTAAAEATPSSDHQAWAVELADSILTFIEQQHAKHSHHPLTPTTLTYNLVMDVWSRSRVPHAPERVEALLQYLQQQEQQHKEQQQHECDQQSREQKSSSSANSLKPTTGSYRAAITAWAHHHPQRKDGEEHSPAERANRLLRQMIDKYQSFLDAGESPTSAAAAAAANDADRPLVEDTMDDSWNRDMDELNDNVMQHSSSPLVVKPIGECFSLVIWAFAKEGKVSQAQAVFQEQCQLFQSTGDLDIAPTVFGMNALIQAWAESDDDPSSALLVATSSSSSSSSNVKTTPQIPGIMAEQLISQMEILAQQTGNDKILPNIHTYRNALKAWVRSCVNPNENQQQHQELQKFLEAPNRAEAMLRRMEFYHESGLLDESPGIASYGMAVDAWCKAGDPERAEALLLYLQSQWQEQDLLDMKPTRIHYHMVMNAWGKSSLLDAPQRATRLLEEMKRADDEDVQPDSVTYFLVSNMWAKSQTKEGQIMVQNLLKEMEMGGTGVDTFGNLFSSNANAPSRRNMKTNGLQVQPNALHYNTVLNSLAKVGDAEGAEALLRQQRSVNDVGQRAFEPDACSYNTVLQAWSRSRRPDAPDRAQALFDELIRKYEKSKDDRLKPTVETFTTMMNINGNSKQPRGVDRAVAIFEDMKRRYQAGATHLKPDVILYTALLNVWAKAGEAEGAESFLDQMVKGALNSDTKSGDKEGTVVVIPNTRSFAAVIAAWANSNDPQAGRRAERILRRMQQLSSKDALQQKSAVLPCRPNTVCYNSTLQAWRKSLLLCRSNQRHREGQQLRTNRNSSFTPEIIIRHMETLLTEMMEQSLEVGDLSVSPDRLSFFIYLTALQRCRPNVLADRSQRAQRVLEWSQQVGLKPDEDLIRRVRQCTG